MTAPMPIPQPLGADVLALNNACAVELSLLDTNRLMSLLEVAFYARRIGTADAFLLAFDENAAYDSPNYLWFRGRYRRFVYVDRVVVAPAARRHGLARRLYTDLFRYATEVGHEVVVCEVNVDPPNTASDAFHAALGFTEVGRATIHHGSKSVRYLSRAIDRATTSSLTAY
jgi:uncharacterized protein